MKSTQFNNSAVELMRGKIGVKQHSWVLIPWKKWGLLTPCYCASAVFGSHSQLYYFDVDVFLW